MPSRLGAALALLASTVALTSRAEDAPPLTLERIVRRSPALSGTSPSAAVWSSDGRSLAFLWNDGALPAREVWIVARDGTGLRRLSPEAGPTPGGVSELAWVPGKAELIYVAGGGLFRIAASGGAPAVLAPAGGERSGLAVSPDGRRLAWLEDGDVWLLVLDGGRPVRATRVAVPPIGAAGAGQYHRRDVEIGTSAWDGRLAPSWSPDGKYLAVQQVDRRRVRRFPIPSYLGPAAALSEVRRAAPGDVNDVRTVALLEVQSRTLHPLAFRSPERWHTLGYAWSPRGQLLVDRESDDAVDRTLTLVEPRTRKLTEVWADHGKGGSTTRSPRSGTPTAGGSSSPGTSTTATVSTWSPPATDRHGCSRPGHPTWRARRSLLPVRGRSPTSRPIRGRRSGRCGGCRQRAGRRSG